MTYNISITIIAVIFLIIVLREFIKVISFNKTNNFDKKYRATRIDANKYSIDKWNK